MFFKSISRLVTAVLVMITLSSCLATKSYKKPDVKAETENLYLYEQVRLDSTTLADMPWKQVFKDPALRNLIQESLSHNLDLQDAIQQIHIAEANFYQGKMNLLPSLNLNATAGYGDLSDNANEVKIPASDRYSVAFSSSWELDVWGKLSSAKKAGFATLLQTEATSRAVQTSLIANVANAYYRLLALDQQLEITQKTVENRKRDVETVKSLKEGSIVTGVSVQQSIANQYAAEVMVPELKQQITEQENALSILLGRTPDHIERTTLSRQQPLDSLATGVPSQLLRNRPDIIASEYNFRSAFELTNNARAYFYPSFTLTAEGGYQALSTQDLFKPGSVFYNIIGGLTQPIFNKGQNKARLKQNKARQEQALLRFRSTILNAGREVSNALSQYQNAEQKREIRQQQLNALENAVSYSQELLQYGESNYTEVLTAQQNLLSAQLNSINDKLQQLTAGVDLYRALGGGWDRTTSRLSASK